MCSPPAWLRPPSQIEQPQTKHDDPTQNSVLRTNTHEEEKRKKGNTKQWRWQGYIYDERAGSPLKECNPLAGWVDTLSCFQADAAWAAGLPMQQTPGGNHWSDSVVHLKGVCRGGRTSLLPLLSHPLPPPSLASLSPKMGHWEVSIIRITLHKPALHTQIGTCTHP